MSRRIQMLTAALLAASLIVAATAAGKTLRALRVQGPPGTLISTQRIPAPAGALAWRILYRSTTTSGRSVEVSGMVVAPKGKPPRGGRNVLAWAHGTTGVTRECAPSQVPHAASNLVNYFSYQSSTGFDVGVPSLTTFLKAGYVVAATDYQGLGTPGVHQYSIGGTEAHSVLDSVRAAHQLTAAGAGLRTVTLGWSEGGGASLWAGQDAAYGAPVKLLGSAALAPNADLYNQFTGAVKVPAGPTNALAPSHDAALALAVFRGFHAAYPSLRPSDALTAQGLTTLGGLAHQCIEHFANNVLQTSVDNGWGLDPSPYLFRAVPLPTPWRNALKANTPGYARAKPPMLIMQGTADTVINPNSTAQFVVRACALSDRVQFTPYPNQTHQTIPTAAASQYVRWIADRFARRPAASNCA